MTTKLIFLLLLVVSSPFTFSQWTGVGSGTNGSSHGLLVWNNQLVDLGSFNNPCQKVSVWNGTTWSCLGGGVGLVARAGTVWNGNLVVVGDFWNVQQPCTNCNGIAMWNGTSWTNLGTGFNNDVLTVTVWNGDLVAAGDFTQADGSPCSRIARWTGTAWVPIGGLSDFDNDIRCLASFQGELWAGGDFNNVGGCSSCDGLVKWNGTAWVGGNSGVDIIGGVDSTVRVLYVNPNDNNLYMGGHFTQIHDGDAASPNTNMAGVARYDGSNWYPLGSGVNNYVRAIHEYNGNLIVGGYFTTAGGTTANRIAKWNPTSQTWSAMGLGFNGNGIDEYVKSACVYNGYFYAGGAYTVTEGSTSIQYLAKWFETPTQPPVANFTASSATICAGSTINFTSTSSGSPTSYSWSFPGGTPASSTVANPSVVYATAGTYNVVLTVTNANGSNTLTQNNSVQVLSQPTTPTITSSNGTVLCTGSSLTLTSSSTTGNSWSTGETTNSISVNAAGTYSVYVNNGACQSSPTTINITAQSAPSAPTVVGSNSVSFCAGDSVQLSVTGTGTIQWNNGLNGSSIWVTQPGNYTAQANNGTCNSANSTAISVTMLAPPATPTINPSGTVTICSGQTVTLTSSATSGNSWSTSESNQSIVVSAPGSYTVTVSNGVCDATSNPTLVQVQSTPAVPVISANGPLAFCSGQSVTLSSSSPIENVWSTNATSQNIVVTQAGTYYVTVGVGSCTAQSNPITVIVHGLPNNAVSLQGINTLSAQANNVSYQWVSCPQFTQIVNATQQQFNASQNGSYAVVLTDVNGCVDTSACLSVTQLGVEDLALASLSIYPNPSSGYLSINYSGEATIQSYWLLDLSGKQIVAERSYNPLLDLSQLADGTYFIGLRFSNGSEAFEKIILQHK